MKLKTCCAGCSEPFAPKLVQDAPGKGRHSVTDNTAAITGTGCQTWLGAENHSGPFPGSCSLPLGSLLPLMWRE